MLRASMSAARGKGGGDGGRAEWREALGGLAASFMCALAVSVRVGLGVGEEEDVGIYCPEPMEIGYVSFHAGMGPRARHVDNDGDKKILPECCDSRRKGESVGSYSDTLPGGIYFYASLSPINVVRVVNDLGRRLTSWLGAVLLRILHAPISKWLPFLGKLAARSDRAPSCRQGECRSKERESSDDFVIALALNASRGLMFYAKVPVLLCEVGEIEFMFGFGFGGSMVDHSFSFRLASGIHPTLQVSTRGNGHHCCKSAMILAVSWFGSGPVIVMHSSKLAENLEWRRIIGSSATAKGRRCRRIGGTGSRYVVIEGFVCPGKRAHLCSNNSMWEAHAPVGRVMWSSVIDRLENKLPYT